MKTKSKIIIGLIVIALISGWFYWYEWRPSQIKKECGIKAGSLYEAGQASDISYGEMSKGADLVYSECLRRQG